MLCLFSALVFLLIRAVRAHKRLIADLDERGVSIAHAQKETGRDSVTRPRTVLRRNTILPFNNSTGWGALPSVETITSAESGGVPAHYVPPMPAEVAKRSSHLSWPFSARRLSGHSVQMKKLKMARLSTVMESPKSSPLLPILGGSHLNTSAQSVAMSSEYANSSCQSLLQHHPAFRHQNKNPVPPGAAARGIVGNRPQMNASKRLQRAQSVFEVPSAQMTRPHLRARSASLCSQTSGMVPDVILPPLPLDIARMKSDPRLHSQLRRVPSKLSVSSFGSVDSTILAARVSPIAPQAAKFRGQKITKPNAKGSNFAGRRPIRDTLDLRTQLLGGRDFAESNVTSASTAILGPRPMHADSAGAESPRSRPSPAHNRQDSQLRDLPSPSASPHGGRSSSTPKRRSKTQVSSSGSPERQYQNPTNPRPSGVMRSPKRQHSQTSSRSSMGNPFQWDPTPQNSTGKPSALKGSPSARKGHGRKNSVRISLVPTFHGPPSRVPSLALRDGHKEDSTGGASMGEMNGIGLGLDNTNALPTPPTSSTFAPDLKFAATSLKASLTSTSPTLPLVGFDQSFVVFPTDQVLPQLSEQEQKRLSNGSMFSLSRFPHTPSVIEPHDVDSSFPFGYPTAYANDFSGNWMPDTPLLQQYPFGVYTPERDQSPSPRSLINIDEYDPEQPSCIYQTPPNPGAVSRSYQSAFAPIPEESSVCSNKTMDVEQSRSGDSPPISPKTMSPPRFTMNERAVYNVPVHATSIAEEPMDTIDPAMLSKDNFSLLNSDRPNTNDSIFDTKKSNRVSIAIPNSTNAAQSMFQPLLDSAFPSSAPMTIGNDSPTIGHVQSELSSSNYSSRANSPSPTSSPIELPSPVFPCSPRPSHAQLPGSTLSINFADVPKLSPSPRGPRGSPPRPLRSSIAQLRRMNSDAADAENAKAGRGERRYLRLGREDGVQVPGDESWLDDLDEDDAVELDEAEGRRLVGDILEDWDEGCTMLDINVDGTLDSFAASKSEKEPTTTVVDLDTTSGASAHSSSIWEDGERFWTSPTPPPPGSPNKPQNHYQPLASSPMTSPTMDTPRTPTSPQRKRQFEVAKDDIPSAQDQEENSSPKSRNKKNNNNGRRHGVVGARYRKRSVLGVGTANVRIQVTSPGGHVFNGNGTPGSLYDSEGFLRI